MISAARHGACQACPPPARIDPWNQRRSTGSGGVRTLDRTPAPCWPEWVWTWDNQTTADLVNGVYMHPVFVRIVRHFQTFFSIGLWPRLDRLPYVSWVPRAYSNVADYLANVAFDERRSRSCTKGAIVSHGSPLVLACDGGFRSKHAGSSLDWALWQVDLCQRSYHNVAFGSSFWTGGTSAFQSEVLGLETALDNLHTLM